MLWDLCVSHPALPLSSHFPRSKRESSHPLILQAGVENKTHNIHQGGQQEKPSSTCLWTEGTSTPPLLSLAFTFLKVSLQHLQNVATAHTFASNRWFVSLLCGDPTQCSTVLPKRLTTTIADLKRAQVTKWGAKTTGSLHLYIPGQKLSAGTTVHRSAHFRHRISVSLRVQTNESISSEGLSDLCQIPEASLEMSAPHMAANKTGCSL